MICKVLGSVVHCITENSPYLYYLYLQQAQLSLTKKGSKNTTLNDILGIVIPELLMNIIFCRGFVNENKSTFIFSCRGKLVDYLFSKCFVILEKHSSELIDVPLCIKQKTNARILHKHFLQCHSTEQYLVLLIT